MATAVCRWRISLRSTAHTGFMREQQKKDILVGYHMQEFVVADGEICAALTTEKPDIDMIRVLIMTNGFKSLFHGAPNMDTLVAMGSTAAFVYSVSRLYVMGYAMGRGETDMHIWQP